MTTRPQRPRRTPLAPVDDPDFHWSTSGWLLDDSLGSYVPLFDGKPKHKPFATRDEAEAWVDEQAESMAQRFVS